jgi:hypothetical protein
MYIHFENAYQLIESTNDRMIVKLPSEKNYKPRGLIF